MAPLRRRRGNGRGRGAGPEETTIFFATDLHGSETCFRKFVAAAGFYGADLLVLGGDLTGKLVVPLVSQPDGRYEAWVTGGGGCWTPTARPTWSARPGWPAATPGA